MPTSTPQLQGLPWRDPSTPTPCQGESSTLWESPGLLPWRFWRFWSPSACSCRAPLSHEACAGSQAEGRWRLERGCESAACRGVLRGVGMRVKEWEFGKLGGGRRVGTQPAHGSLAQTGPGGAAKALGSTGKDTCDGGAAKTGEGLDARHGE